MQNSDFEQYIGIVYDIITMEYRNTGIIYNHPRYFLFYFYYYLTGRKCFIFNKKNEFYHFSVCCTK